jgi:hypothetical protein
MVDPSSTPMITGIIDWDEAVYAPKFAAAVAPTWLWEPPEEKEDDDKEEEDDEDDEDDDGSVQDPDIDEEKFEKSNAEPPTPELQAVKRAWEDAVGPECADSARDHYAILARRILRFAAAWQWEDWWHQLYYDTIDEWKALQGLEESDDESEDGSEDESEDMEVDIPEDDDDSAWETCSEEDEEDADEDDSEPGSDDIPEYDGDSAWETCSEDEGEDD